MTGLPSSPGVAQDGSTVAFSATPTTSPRLFTPPLAQLLLPPRVASGVITRFCQAKPRQTRWVPYRQKSSPNGSGVEVSAFPATSPLSLGRLNAELFGPPNVPSPVLTHFHQRKACFVTPPARISPPLAQPLSLRPSAKFCVEPRSVTT